MELFFDGGLFEIAGLLLFASLFNYIFSKKYLLIIFSAGAIIAPALLFFVRDKEIFNWLVAFLLLNSIVFVWMLWKERKQMSNGKLFETDHLKKKLTQLKDRVRFVKQK